MYWCFTTKTGGIWKKRLTQQRIDLYKYRHLFVQHRLSPSERKRWWRITRDLPQLRKPDSTGFSGKISNY
jgi:hypothetical protein